VAGWVTLHFWRGIQQNFKAIHLEPVSRTEVLVPDEVTLDALVNQGQEEVPGEV